MGCNINQILHSYGVRLPLRGTLSDEKGSENSPPGHTDIPYEFVRAAGIGSVTHIFSHIRQ
eukprot:1339870-Amorphochlora_amoeboformis.AAC.1